MKFVISLNNTCHHDFHRKINESIFIFSSFSFADCVRLPDRARVRVPFLFCFFLQEKPLELTHSKLLSIQIGRLRAHCSFIFNGIKWCALSRNILNVREMMMKNQSQLRHLSDRSFQN